MLSVANADISKIEVMASLMGKVQLESGKSRRENRGFFSTRSDV